MTDETQAADPAGGGDRPEGPGSKEPPDLDAVRRDKRRPVVGRRYGATRRKQLTVYGAFLGVLAGLVVALLTVVSGVDGRGIELEDTAPWTEAAAQREPRDTDFPCNGPLNTIPAEQIGETPPARRSEAEIDGC